MMVLITISLALVQTLAARMGVVTGKGLAELVRETYGIRWSAFATLAALVPNLGICVSDFVGVGAAFDLGGIPAQLAVPIAAATISVLASATIIVAPGAALSARGILPPTAAPDAATASAPFAGRSAEALFGIGLIGAGLLACAILPIPTSYVVSESLGFERGLV